MLRYDKGATSEMPDEFPAEFPLRLMVNGREIAVPVASPNELRLLEAGFRIRGELPERVRTAVQTRLAGVAGVILAGGESSRMGRNKALLEVNGERMVETAYRRIAELFDEVLLVTNTPEIYGFIPCRKIADIYPGMGPLGGIHAALSGCNAERAFVTACDMPSLNPQLIRELSSMQGGTDVVIPETPGGLEPLHAVYAKSCLPMMEIILRAGERRILSFFDQAQVRLVPRGRIAALDPDFSSFRNINTPEDYQRLAQRD